MTLDGEAQEFLGAIVEECLGAIEDGSSGSRLSSRSNLNDLSRSMDYSALNIS